MWAKTGNSTIQIMKTITNNDQQRCFKRNKYKFADVYNFSYLGCGHWLMSSEFKSAADLRHK